MSANVFIKCIKSVPTLKQIQEVSPAWYGKFLRNVYCHDSHHKGRFRLQRCQSQIIFFEFTFKLKININKKPSGEFHSLKPSNNRNIQGVIL